MHSAPVTFQNNADRKLFLALAEKISQEKKKMGQRKSETSKLSLSLNFIHIFYMYKKMYKNI